MRMKPPHRHAAARQLVAFHDRVAGALDAPRDAQRPQQQARERRLAGAERPVQLDDGVGGGKQRRRELVSGGLGRGLVGPQEIGF